MTVRLLRINKLFVCLTWLWLISGCSTSSLLPNQVSTTDATDTITFLDTETFDQSLSNELSTNFKQVEVIPLASSPIKMNAIPDRLVKWLSAVVNNKGKLEIEPKAEKSAMAFDPITAILSTVYDYASEYLKQNMLYSPAQNYNAVIHYQPETNVVSKIVFLNKKSVLPILDSVTSSTSTTSP